MFTLSEQKWFTVTYTETRTILREHDRVQRIRWIDRSSGYLLILFSSSSSRVFRQSPNESPATEIYLTMGFDVSLQSSSLEMSYKYPGKQHIQKKILKTLGFLALACVAFHLPEQLLLCQYEERTLTKGNVCPWIFTGCKCSSAQAKPCWQNVRPYMHFLCCSVQHVRNANQHLKGNVGFQRRPTETQNGNIYSPTKKSSITCDSSVSK